jgi:hypothetical protein
MEELNTLGKQGWELAAVVPYVEGSLGGNTPDLIDGSPNSFITLIFKRRKP